MSINLQLPTLTDLRPRLTVIGVGGAGCNAVNNMIAAGLTGVEFVVANTDAQALAASSAEHRLQLGVNLTEGLGAGSKPEIGEAAAEEAVEEIRAQVSGAHMLFIAAGMGGGTGTGACSVIARVAREMGILVVGVVTKPFLFEGTRRQRTAEAGIADLRKHVDTLIVIPNQNLFRIANEKTTFAEAFVLADQVLYSGVACIVDLILKDGLINLDFADVRTIMSGMGTAMMGTGEASGDRRAIMAAEEAISNPLLDDVTLRGARGLLLSITGSHDMTLYEVDEAASRVRQEVDPDANIIVGATFDDSLGDAIRVSIVASGMSRADAAQPPAGDATAGGWQQQSAPQKPVAPAATSAAAPAESQWIDTQQAAAAPPHSHAAEPSHGQAYEQLLSQSIGAASDAGAGYAAAQPASSQEAPRAPRRETWTAPGNVTIEAGYQPHPAATAPPPPLPGGGYAAAPAAEPARPATAEPFRAQPPIEVRRPPQQRRMPEVEDFPVVGQRDYYAKSGAEPARGAAGVGNASQSRPGDRRKPGLFERIAGMGRKADDSPADPRQAQPAGGARAQGGHANAGQIAHGSSSERHGSGPGGHDESVELPMFFNKKRK
jgi:cell division protein FtsZ